MTPTSGLQWKLYQRIAELEAQLLKSQQEIVELGMKYDDEVIGSTARITSLEDGLRRLDRYVKKTFLPYEDCPETRDELKRVKALLQEKP